MIKSLVSNFYDREVMLCAMQYLFVRTEQGRGTKLSEGCISFATENGFFAALGHNEEPDDFSYKDAELYAQHTTCVEPPQAGRILRSLPSGVYGAFYDDYAPPTFAKMKIASLNELKVDSAAELWMPIGTGELKVLEGKIAALFPDKPYPVLFKCLNKVFLGAGFGSSGSVIVQGGKLAAVVAGANEVPSDLLYCTSAERMMHDLGQMLSELSSCQ